MKRLFSLLGFVALLVGCSSDNGKQLTTIKISNIENVIEFDGEYLDVKNVKVIPLEYTDKSMLGGVTGLSSSEEFLIIHDLINIYLFDKESGKVVNMISHRGKSDQEYLDVLGVSSDDKERELYVIDLNGKKINVYNYDGDFVRQVKSDTMLTFDKIDDNRFVGYNGGMGRDVDYQFNLTLYDKDFNFIKGLDRRTEEEVATKGYFALRNCLRYGKGYYNYLRDTVFSVTTEGLSPLLAIDKGVYKVPVEVANDMDEIGKYIAYDNATLFGDYLLYRLFIPNSGTHRLQMWNLNSNKLLFQYDASPAEGRNGIPIKFEDEVIYPRILHVDGNDRIYCMLPQSSVESAGIENDDNPVIISFELQ